MGRNTKMTKDVLTKLEDAFALGCTDEEACAYADISHTTLYNYQNANPHFLEEKQRLKQLPFIKARQSIIANLNDPDFALKYMERKKKNEFSIREEHEIRLEDPRISILSKYGLGVIGAREVKEIESRSSQDSA